MNRQQLTEWQQSFETQNPLYATDLLPDLKIIVFRKSLHGTRTVGVFETPEEILTYIHNKHAC